MSDKLQPVIDANKEHMREFSRSALVEIVRNEHLPGETKDRILDYLQPWCDTFQRIIALRVACESDSDLRAFAQYHLTEELNHNTLLAGTRVGGRRREVWDPVIAGASSWFVDQMMTVPGVHRAVLAHLVLEGSGMVFHQAGSMAAYGDNEFFELHGETDQEHLEMGYRLLAEHPDWRTEDLLRLLDRGWRMITALCDRVAEFAVHESSDERRSA
jgi:hypothetical protein